MTKIKMVIWILLLVFAVTGPGNLALGDQIADFGYDDYAAILRGFVDDEGSVNYRQLKADRSQLDSFCKSIGDLDRAKYYSWTDQGQIAFWINTYNALTLKAIIDNYPIKSSLLRTIKFPRNSIRQIPGVWDKLQFKVMGQKMTLDQIEHERLRAKFNEPRIHVGLVCAAMGCPPLRNTPYIGDKLSVQLDDQVRKFLSEPGKFRIDREKADVSLSSIFKWFGGDFIKTHLPSTGFGDHSDEIKASLNFISRYLPPEKAKYLRDGKYAVVFTDYDWSLNEHKPTTTTKPESK